MVEVLKQVEKIYPDYDTEINRKQFGIIYAWFTRADNFSTLGENYSLKKGLLLKGKIGCGKTKMINLFQQLTKTFYIKPAQDLTRELLDSNENEVIYRYSSRDYSKKNIGGHYLKTYNVLCIDDLGFETEIVHYNNAKIAATKMAELIAARYYCFQRDGMKTIATTNYRQDQMSKIYGERITDRMREMFNVIEFEGDSLRK